MDGINIKNPVPKAYFTPERVFVHTVMSGLVEHDIEGVVDLGVVPRSYLNVLLSVLPVC